jgi:hypothetical protein
MAVVQPTKRGGVPGWIKGCGIAAAVGLVLFIGIVVLFGVCTANVAKNISQNTGKQTSGACSPQPCANANGWNVYVSDVNKNAQSATAPEAGNTYVTLNVRFKNDTADEQHANPTEFVLRDSTGVKHSETWLGGAAGCDSWEPVNLTKGATFGPRCIAFQAKVGDNALVLTWTSVFRDYDIKLT